VPVRVFALANRFNRVLLRELKNHVERSGLLKEGLRVNSIRIHIKKATPYI
jgi:hypothetical protein